MWQSDKMAGADKSVRGGALIMKADKGTSENKSYLLLECIAHITFAMGKGRILQQKQSKNTFWRESNYPIINTPQIKV